MHDDPSMSLGGDEVANLIVIVVGAHLRAEAADRPLAYRLRDHVVTWLKDHPGGTDARMTPIVCSDIWYLNQESLHRHPTISLGGPGVNALSAYYTDKLPPALMRDNHLAIQLDPAHVDLRACVWGVDHELTVAALDLFLQRYCEGYLRAAATQFEPHSGC